MRIWIARPEPDARRTARRVADLGHVALVAPIFAFERSGAELPVEEFDALVMTSANAALSGVGRLHDAVPTFCVGGKTAEAARAAGFGSVQDAGGNALALSKFIRKELQPGARLLHLAGAEHKAEPGASLAAAGYDVTIHIAYAMRAATELPDPVAKALDGGDLQAALHYSRRGAETAAALAEAAGRGGAFRALTHYCLSVDVAAPLVAVGCCLHVTAERPNEDSLLTSLTLGG